MLTIGIRFSFSVLFILSIFITQVCFAEQSQEPQPLTDEQKLEQVKSYFESEYQEEDYFRTDRLLLQSISFFPTEIRKAPGYSFIITADQIEKSPSRSLRDVIEMRVPGMTTGGHVRHGPLIGTRGVFIDNNAKTMVMLDGQQLNQRGHFGYTAGLLSPLLGDIKKVEIVLGPGAILHGSGAINGFIDMIPKNGIDNPGLFIDSELGFVDELWKIETGYGASYGPRKNYYVYAGAYGAEGYQPDELYGFSKNHDTPAQGFKGGNYRFSLYWNHDNFNLNGFYYENNPYKNGTFEIGHFHQATLGFRPKYVFEINDTDSFEVIGSLLWFDHLTQDDLSLDSGIISDRGGAENHWELKNIYSTRRWNRHLLAAGFFYGEKHFYQRKQFFSSDAKKYFGTLDTEWQEFGLFSEDVINIDKSWVISLGLRYDKIYLESMSSDLWDDAIIPDQINGHFSSRIATAYDLDSDTTVKASYQHGFRTPDVFYYVLGLRFTDAAKDLGFSTIVPALGVETMDSFELNLQKDLHKHAVKLDFNLFYNIFKDQLSFKYYDDIGLFTSPERDAIKTYLGIGPLARLGSFINSPDEIKSYGGEINATFQPLSHAQVSLSYGYVRLDNTDLMQYPGHQIKLNTLLYFLDKKLSLAMDYLFNSSYSETGLPNGHDIYRHNRHVVDMALNYNINRNARISVSVNNLFENDVPPMVFTPDLLDRGGLGYDKRRVYLSLQFWQ